MIIEYPSVEAKQRTYVERTIPAIFAAVSDADRTQRFKNLPGTPRALHDLLRGGRYVREYGPRDNVQSVVSTLQQGGDCEDWAAVALALAGRAGIRARLVTAGGWRDNFEHAYVELYDRGRWIASNPKGSIAGMDYGARPDYSVVRRWTLDGNGRVVEVGDVGGSGADPAGDPLIKTTRDLQKYLTSDQIQRWMATFSNQQKVQVNAALLHGYASYRRSEILQRIGDVVQQQAARAAAKTGDVTGVQSATTDYLDKIKQVKTLADVNRVMASFWVKDWIEPGEGQQVRISQLRQFAIQLGGNPDADTKKLSSVAVFVMSRQATSLNVLFDDWIQTVQSDPDAAKKLKAAPEQAAHNYYQTLTGQTLSGSGKDPWEVFTDGIQHLVSNPVKWFNNVVEEIGKGAKELAENVFDAEKIPFLGDFFLKPLGFHAQAVILDQLGNVLVHHSVSAFDEKAVALAAGETLTAAGRALIVASPFLPPPYDVLAAAVGALSMAAGGLITDAVSADSPLNTGKIGQDQQVTVYVDQYGRAIAADGLPVDPYQRQVELQRRANAAQAVQAQPDPATQTAGEWRRGSDGLWYGWHQLGTPNWYWVALLAQQNAQGQAVVTAAWYWTGQGWRALS